MRRLSTLLVVLGTLAAARADACAVCWGGASDSPMIDGTKLSIAFMAILTYLVLGGFVAGFVYLSRRARSEAAETGLLETGEKER